jgi:hypothetical protein
MEELKLDSSLSSEHGCIGNSTGKLKERHCLKEGRLLWKGHLNLKTSNGKTVRKSTAF